MGKETDLAEHGSSARTTIPGRAGDPYSLLMHKIATDRCVVLDGATGSELFEVEGQRPELDDHMWGVGALAEAPDQVGRIHQRYVAIGCDVVSTATWGLPTALRQDQAPRWESGQPVHWMDSARRAVRIARAATAEHDSQAAVAFSINGDVDTPEGAETIRLLARAFESDRPDLILLETLSLVRSSTYATLEALLEIGLPVWLSFRRCRHGVCGVYGEHWGGPEGDSFGRSARRFEEMGIGALLINCIPPDHVPGMISWLRDFTDLPLGVYPNLGYLSSAGWRTDGDISDSDYGELALSWRAEGAQIIGGCCGVGPDHIAAVVKLLEESKPGDQRPPEPRHAEDGAVEAGAPGYWQDDRARGLFPLEFPNIAVDEGVFAPTQGSFLIWQYLFQQGIGAHQRCLDVGCGSGLLTVQLARNGASHVHALDIDQAAVDNTLTNAFRNGVADRVSAAAADLYPWVPEERYDLIVASLYQMPVDPFEQVTTHRPLDFWGRNLIDHLIKRLPEALADDGTAYIMQLSIIGERRTVEQLEAVGYRARIVSFAFFEFNELFTEKKEQILRVEEQSDAYHLRLGDHDVMVAYLIEVTPKVEEGADI